MTETNSNNQKSEKKFASKARKSFTSLIIISGVVFLGYFAFGLWKNEIAKKNHAKAEIRKTDNVDSEIFDLAEGYDSSTEGVASEMAVNEIRERGAEFVYQTLLKHQMQIDDLYKQMKDLQGDFAKYKSQEKIAKTVFAYVDLRQDFIAGKDHEESFKNFEMLAAFDVNLDEKTKKLKAFLAKFPGDDQLFQSFQKLIPQLIINKNKSADSGISEKIYRNLSRLVVIRKIKENGGNDIDSVIVRTEKFLRERKYHEAYENLLPIRENHQEILQDFLNDLEIASQVKDADADITNYLKSLR